MDNQEITLKMAITPLHERAHVRAAVIRIKWPKATNSLSIFIYLARAPRQAKGLSQPAKPARTSLYQRHNPHNPIQAGKAGEPTPFQQYSSHNLLRQAGKAGKAPATSKILPTTTKPAKPARSPLFQRNSSHIPAKPAKPPASYQQVKL